MEKLLTAKRYREAGQIGSRIFENLLKNLYDQIKPNAGKTAVTAIASPEEKLEGFDELTQLLFIFEHFDQIIGAPDNGPFLHRWKTKWTAIQGARNYFDKITEELVEIHELAGSADPFLRSVAGAYRAYESALYQNNRVDFAHLQRIAYDLLADKTLCDDLTKNIRYVLVDEYQDTLII